MHRDLRLRSRSDFAQVTRDGGRVTRPEFVLYHFAREGSKSPRVGFSVGRRIGSAVIRNRVRRHLREAIRPLLGRLAAADLVVVVRPAAVGAGVAGLGRAFEDAAARAGLLLDEEGTG